MTDCSPCKKGVILYSGAIGDCLLTLPLAHYIKQACDLALLDYISPTGYTQFYPQRTCVDRVRSIETLPLHHLFADSKTFMQDDHHRLQHIFDGYEQVISLIGHNDPNFEKNLLFTLHSTHSAELTIIPAKPNTDYNKHIADFYIDFFKQDNQLERNVPMPAKFIIPLSGDTPAGLDLIEQARLNSNKEIVLIAPGSGSLEKCWHLDNFIQVAEHLKQNQIQTAFLLGPAEHERFAAADLNRLRNNDTVIENLNLTQILQILTQTDIFLGNDSGIAHLSAMMGKKTVALFGPSNHHLYQPLGSCVKVLRPDAGSFSAPDPASGQAVMEVLLKLL
jgi:ADP-heptose:LPS heptosyltransferase